VFAIGASATAQHPRRPDIEAMGEVAVVRLYVSPAIPTRSHNLLQYGCKCGPGHTCAPVTRPPGPLAGARYLCWPRLRDGWVTHHRQPPQHLRGGVLRRRWMPGRQRNSQAAECKVLACME
jgi:hypothetical protein